MHASSHRKILAITLGVLAIAATGCGGSSSSSGDAGGTYNWGINAEISGSLAFYGDSIRDGVKAYVDQVNAAGGIAGHKINLTILDNAGDSARAATNQTQLATSSVDAIFGNTLSSNCAAAAPISQRYKVPESCLSVDKPGDYVYSFGPNNIQAAGPVLAAAKQLVPGGTPKVASAYVNTLTAIGMGKAIKAQASSAGVDLVADEQINIAGTDFSSTISKIVSAKPDVIVLSGTGPNFLAIMKGVRAAHLDSKFIWVDGTSNLSQVQDVDDPNIYAFAAYNLVDPNTATGVAKQYVDAVSPSLKTVDNASLATGNTAVAYLGAAAFGQALKECGYPCSGQQLNAKLANLKADLSPMEPSYSYSDGNHFPFPKWYLYQVKKGGVYTPVGSFKTDPAPAS